ncbi:hypothetical protein ECG_09911 [Echinococcus granulosus]|nr:hypothetical protein ECG_09911 [Echinococcus granulosus]
MLEGEVINQRKRQQDMRRKVEENLRHHKTLHETKIGQKFMEADALLWESRAVETQEGPSPLLVFLFPKLPRFLGDDSHSLHRDDSKRDGDREGVRRKRKERRKSN